MGGIKTDRYDKHLFRSRTPFGAMGMHSHVAPGPEPRISCMAKHMLYWVSYLSAFPIQLIKISLQRLDYKLLHFLDNTTWTFQGNRGLIEFISYVPL